jgi:hypothetical protein
MNMHTRISILSGLLLALTPLALADDVALYSNIPNSLPGNIPSLGYEATGTGEFGGLVQLAGGNTIDSATVVMSNWAYQSNWTSYINGTTITTSGFYLPITLTLYNVGAGNTVGSVIATETLANAFIPWRPEPDPTDCAAGSNNNYLAATGGCWAGSLSTLTFNFSGLSVPSEFIYGLSFDTTHYGTDPTGVAGPYESLNFGLTTASPSTGSNPDPSTFYWNSGSGDAFQPNTGLNDGSNPYNGVIEFDGPAAATPEPSSLMLLGTGLLALATVLLLRTRLYQS